MYKLQYEFQTHRQMEDSLDLIFFHIITLQRDMLNPAALSI